MLYCTEIVAHNGLDWIGAGERNHGEAVYIIKAKPCISSIPQELHLIKPQIYTLKRDDIQKGEFSPFLMIYRLASDDIPSLRLG